MTFLAHLRSTSLADTFGSSPTTISDICNKGRVGMLNDRMNSIKHKKKILKYIENKIKYFNFNITFNMELTSTNRTFYKKNYASSSNSQQSGIFKNKNMINIQE